MKASNGSWNIEGTPSEIRDFFTQEKVREETTEKIPKEKRHKRHHRQSETLRQARIARMTWATKEAQKLMAAGISQREAYKEAHRRYKLFIRDNYAITPPLMRSGESLL